jgi:hypothetical protein
LVHASQQGTSRPKRKELIVAIITTINKIEDGPLTGAIFSALVQLLAAVIILLGRSSATPATSA